MTPRCLAKVRCESVFAAAIVCVLAAATFAAYGEAWNEEDFLHVEALKRGDSGYMLTVLEDSTVQRLEVRILSVEHEAFPKGAVIWAEGTDEKFRHLGVAAGMSGSPVFVGGRLIGACAYTFSFAKDPILGITPIAQMLRVWERDMSTTRPPRRARRVATGFDAFPSLPQWSASNPHAQDMFAFAAPPTLSADAHRDAPELDPVRGTALRRIAMPLMLGGFGEAAEGIVERLFNGKGLIPVPGTGGGARHSSAGVPVENGSTIGIEFVRGDLNAFGYGTVTLRQGNRILAFGHPMFGEGDSHLPMSSGAVHFVLANRMFSFKVASPSRVVGTLVQDRESGIAGVLHDDSPPYLPMTVRIRTRSAEEPREYRYELLRHRLFTGGLAMSVVASTLSSAEKSLGDYSIVARATVRFQDERHPTLVKENVLSGSMSPASAAASVLAPIGAIVDNWYDEIGIASIEVDIQYRSAFDTAVIESARLARERVAPGESLRLLVTYRPFLDEPTVVPYEIAIPEGAEEGYATVFVGDNDSYEGWERSRAPDRYRPANAQQMLELLARGGTHQRLWISIVSTNIGVAIRGLELPNLPLSVLSVMTPPTSIGEGQPTRGSIVCESIYETPFVVHGSTLLPIFIDRSARSR